MDDDFTLKYEGKNYPAKAQPDFPPTDDLKALQTQAVCILVTRFGHKTPHSTLGDDWEGIWDNESLIDNKDILERMMKRLLENAAESLDKENPFPTFEITGVLTKEDFIRRGYGTGFYIFQSIMDEGENDVTTRYFSLVYLDVNPEMPASIADKSSSKMITQWVGKDAAKPERGAGWFDGNLKKGKSGWKWKDLVQFGPFDDWWRHSVSFLGTSCADPPLKGTGIINWVTF